MSTFFVKELEALKEESVGINLAVMATLPRVEGRQLQATVSEIDGLLMQPGSFFPPAKKVTLPSVPATPKVAVSIELDLKVTIDGEALKEMDEFDCITPPVPSSEKRNAPSSFRVAGVAETPPSNTRDRVQPDNEPVVTAEYVKHTYTCADAERNIQYFPAELRATFPV